MEELEEYMMTGGFLKNDYLLYPRVFHITQTMLPNDLLPNGRPEAELIHPNGQYYYLEKSLLSESFGRHGFGTPFYLYELDENGERMYIEKLIVKRAPDELINRVFSYIVTENQFMFLDKSMLN